METKHEKRHGGSAFFWGLVVGALLATLLTTKKGRLILREIVNLGLEMIEEIIEEKRNNHSKEAVLTSEVSNLKDETEEIIEDLESEVTETETASSSPEDTEEESEKESAENKINGNGHHKKRLFRGVRRK
jgi:hypothetical protein